MKFAKSHEWIKIEGDIAIMGVSDHAQNELTEIVFIELPSVGETLIAGQPCCVVESVKSASDVYAPISGEVVEINEDILNEPAMVNNDPEGAGWFMKIKFSNVSDIEALMTKEEYLNLVS